MGTASKIRRRLQTEAETASLTSSDVLMYQVGHTRMPKSQCVLAHVGWFRLGREGNGGWLTMTWENVVSAVRSNEEQTWKKEETSGRRAG